MLQSGGCDHEDPRLAIRQTIEIHSYAALPACAVHSRQALQSSALRRTRKVRLTSRTLRALPLNGFERSEWTACNNFSFQMQLWIDKENRFAYKSTSPKQLQIFF
jgi:hypothetical protein